eukprot:g2336.t1
MESRKSTRRDDNDGRSSNNSTDYRGGERRRRKDYPRCGVTRADEEFTELSEFRLRDWKRRDGVQGTNMGDVKHVSGENATQEDDVEVESFDESLKSVLAEVEAHLNLGKESGSLSSADVKIEKTSKRNDRGDNNNGGDNDGEKQDDDDDDDENASVDDRDADVADNDADDDEEEEDIESETKELPVHACSYCKVSDPSCVVMCMDCAAKNGGTGKWFCNGCGVRGSGYSCIVQHLVRARHKCVRLHPESALGDTVLECYSSGSKNVFQLGFVSASSDNVMVLLTRDVCMNKSQLEEMSWDADEWLPLIKDGQFRDWLVNVPGERETRRSRRITREQIAQLEDLWRTNIDADLKDLEGSESENAIPPVLPSYEDAFQYQNIFGPLVKMEADEDKAAKEGQSQGGVVLERWYQGLSKQHVAEIRVSCRDGGELRFVPGDEIRLKRLMGNGRTWQSVGTVKRIEGSSIHAEMREKKVPEQHLDRYSLEFVWKSVTYDRMQASLRKFALDDTSVSQYIFHNLLGHQVVPQTLKTTMPDKFSAPGLPELNHSQADAVKKVLETPMALVQGPPGTGKTVTSAAILYHLAKQKNIGQILVCAPSNVGVDQLTEKIHRTGIRVVRLAARSREDVESNVEALCLHNMVRALAGATSSNGGRGRGRAKRNDLRKLFQLKDTVGELSPRDERKFHKLVRASERKLLKSAQIICTTCVGAGDPRLRKFRFRTVLIDEATQATEPECLIPIVNGCRRLIVVGDHCQLGPVVTCKAVAKAGLNQSLFERLIILGIRPIRLQVQYRMHPALSEFPSNTFYEGSLQNGTTDSERVLDKVDFPWPRADCPMFFHVNNGIEEMGKSGTSFLNRSEAAAVERVVTAFLKGGCTPDQIGVITPYEGQRSFIESYVAKSGTLNSVLYRAIEITSVDGFQGREKDLIIISCVRSNEKLGIGFLSDPRRLNVALTRAKYGVVIIGNPNVLCRNSLWNNLLVHFKERDVLVEGPLSNLKISRMRLRPSRKYYNRRKYQMMAHAYARATEGRPIDLSSLPMFPGGRPMHHFAHEGPVHGMLDVGGHYSYGGTTFDPRYFGGRGAFSVTGSTTTSETMSVCSQDSALYPPSIFSEGSFAFPHGRLGGDDRARKGASKERRGPGHGRKGGGVA